MGFLPRIPFINNKQESTPPTSAPAQPIIQKKPLTRKPKPKSTLLHSSKATTSSRMETTNIDGHTIRVFSYENQQYYCINDFAKASKEDFLTKNPKLNNSDLAEVEVEEDGQKITLQFTTKQPLA